MTTNKPNNSKSPFDALRLRDGNVEYWPAKELMTLMGYQQWGEFCEAIDRAIESSTKECGEETKNLAGTPPPLNEPGLMKDNYRLSRKICGHIAANGDATKPEIVAARRYFGSGAAEEVLNLVVAMQDDGVLVIDSRLVAKGLGIDHHNFMQTILKHRGQAESAFGILLFETKALKGRGQPEKYCLLNEGQSTFYMTLSRNTPPVVRLKAGLVKAFFDAKRKLAEKQSKTVESSRNNLEKQFLPKPTQKEIRASYGMWKMAHGKPYADRWLGQMHQRYYPYLIGETPQAQEMTSLATAKALLTPTQIAEELGLLYKTGSGNGAKVNSLLVKLARFNRG
jgi:phage regulator Rha-like protein